MPYLTVFISILLTSLAPAPAPDQGARLGQKGVPIPQKAAAELPGVHPRVRVHAAPGPRASDAVTEDWPSLYGPRRDGRTNETHLSREWPKGGPELLWELDRGEGYACPVIVGDRLVYTHLRGDTTVVECLRPKDGKRWWEFRFASDFDGEIIRNDGPRASAVIAGDRVFVHDTAGSLYCLALSNGKRLWHRDLQSEFDLPDSFFGVCSTPLPWNDRLIVNLGAGPEGPCIVALDQKTGRRVWAAKATGGASCSPPIAVEHAGRPWVFLLTGGKTRPTKGAFVSLDPRNGAVDFEIPWRTRSYYSVNACVPIFVDGRVFIMADKGMGSAMIEPRLDATTKKVSGEIVWRNPDVGFEFVGTVHDNGRLYVFDGEDRIRTGLVCLDATTGERLWLDRIELEGKVRPGQASILLADGDALCLGESGTLFWLRLGDKGSEILRQARLFRARESWTPPVIHDGLLFIAQNRADVEAGTKPRLLCYDLRARK